MRDSVPGRRRPPFRSEIRTRAGAALPRALHCPRRGLTPRRPATDVEPLCRHFSTPSRLLTGQPPSAAGAVRAANGHLRPCGGGPSRVSLTPHDRHTSPNQRYGTPLRGLAAMTPLRAMGVLLGFGLREPSAARSRVRSRGERPNAAHRPAPPRRARASAGRKRLDRPIAAHFAAICLWVRGRRPPRSRVTARQVLRCVITSGSGRRPAAVAGGGVTRAPANVASERGFGRRLARRPDSASSAATVRRSGAPRRPRSNPGRSSRH